MGAETEEDTVNKIRAVTTLLFLAITPAALAHPGHPTLNPHHSHGALELNPVTLILLAAIAIGMLLVGRGTAVRRSKPWRNSDKK